MPVDDDSGYGIELEKRRQFGTSYHGKPGVVREAESAQPKQDSRVQAAIDEAIRIAVALISPIAPDYRVTIEAGIVVAVQTALRMLDIETGRVTVTLDKDAQARVRVR